MKTPDAKFKQLIELCDTIGPTNGITKLRLIVKANEDLQAHLFSGNHSEIKQATKLSKTIIRQNLSIARLKEHYGI